MSLFFSSLTRMYVGVVIFLYLFCLGFANLLIPVGVFCLFFFLVLENYLQILFLLNSPLLLEF